jgi:hypothetical protein
MSNVLKLRSRPEVAPIARGTVLACEGRRIAVLVNGVELAAERALSCAFLPAVDDEVLVACEGSGATHVIAILTRPGGAPLEVSLDSDLRVRLPAHRLTVTAKRGIDLVSAEEVNLASAAVRMTAAQGTVAIDQLAVLGSVLHAEVVKVKAFLGSMDTFVDRLTQRARQAIRVVKELDLLRAEQIDHGAQKTLRLTAENAIVGAEELVKMDGAQVHIG